jgi:3-ketosteroid 9alpha-monooxygenase subunit A
VCRGVAGAARVLDAHCPHLGAHLGVGGRVRGDGIQCPFHGWRFDAAGRCVEVPRLERPPPEARVRSYPVCERNESIHVWVHAHQQAPDWEPGELRPGGAECWTDWTTRRYEVRTHVQELGENILDLPHFWNVHEMDVGGDRHFEARFEAHQMIVEQSLAVTSGAPGVEVRARTVNSGPGLSVTHVAFGPVETLTFISQTPVDECLLELRLHFCMRRLDDAAAMAAIEKQNCEFINRQFSQDIPIWEHKVYREKPPLTAIDGPVPQYRRWFRQFYSAWAGEPA